MSSCEREPCVISWGVEKGEARVGSKGEVGGGFILLLNGEESRGVGGCIVDVEVACDKVEVFKVPKGGYGGDGVRVWVERPCVCVADPKTGKTGAETTLWSKHIKCHEVVC